jgi:cell division protein FtsN
MIRPNYALGSLRSGVANVNGISLAKSCGPRRLFFTQMLNFSTTNENKDSTDKASSEQQESTQQPSQEKQTTSSETTTANDSKVTELQAKLVVAEKKRDEFKVSS